MIFNVDHMYETLYYMQTLLLKYLLFPSFPEIHLFFLLTACPLGIDSSMAVPRHVYVRLPNTSVSGSQSETCVQQQICRCGNKKLDNCHSIPCTGQAKCHLGGAQGGISKSK